MEDDENIEGRTVEVWQVKQISRAKAAARYFHLLARKTTTKRSMKAPGVKSQKGDPAFLKKKKHNNLDIPYELACLLRTHEECLFAAITCL